MRGVDGEATKERDEWTNTRGYESRSYLAVRLVLLSWWIFVVRFNYLRPGGKDSNERLATSNFDNP